MHKAYNVLLIYSNTVTPLHPRYIDAKPAFFPDRNWTFLSVSPHDPLTLHYTGPSSAEKGLVKTSNFCIADSSIQGTYLGEATIKTMGRGTYQPDHSQTDLALERICQPETGK